MPNYDFAAVQRLLRDKLGALRIIFKEEGAKDFCPAIEVVHQEIVSRWDMSEVEQKTLMQMLRLARPPGGREVADYSSFCRILRGSGKFHGSSAGNGPIPQPPPGETSAAINKATSRSLPHVGSPRSMRRSEMNDLRGQLMQHATGPKGTVSYTGFMASLAIFDSSMDPHESRKFFNSAVKMDPTTNGQMDGKYATVEALVRIALPHMSLSRQRVLSSELVRDVMAWDKRPEERILMPGLQTAAAVEGSIPRIASASRTTRSQQFKLESSQKTIASIRANDQWHISPRAHKAPSPRKLPKPSLTPRRDEAARAAASGTGTTPRNKLHH